MLAGHALLWAGGVRRAPAEPVGPTTISAAVAQTSESCAPCHQEIHARWSDTDHARANRPVASLLDHTPFTAHPTLADGGASYTVSWEGNNPLLRPAPAPGAPPAHRVEMLLGSRPLWQPVVATTGGRWQALDLAFDVNRHDWFNVFGQEHRRPGEWGHWTGRGMNWNSRCASCHMTGYRKNYDAAHDTYQSTWVEHGIGCIQCHGPTQPHHGAKEAAPARSPGPFHGDRARMMETCAPCHARQEALTEHFEPGDTFADHYRVTLPVEAGRFFPDGQQRDEDFNWTSVLLSRMGHAGVTCLDCHDPHTAKTILPSQDNQLCLQCHAAPGRVLPTGTPAVPIDPVAHSHHAADSPGNACVACHMPTTNYLQRAPRHDHGWLRPDPLLTQELGIPNACSRCHQDQPVAWAIAHTDAWYGAKMNSRQRARARAVARAQAGQAGAPDALLELLRQDDLPAWRATYLALLAPYAQDPRVARAGQAALSDPAPLARSAAVRLLTGTPAADQLLPPLLHDPVRLVRLDAEWALSAGLAAGSPERAELDAYLKFSLDQPAGRLRLGQELANRGDLPAAAPAMAQAAAWDPGSPGILAAQATVLAGLNRPAEAGALLLRAGALAPNDATLPMRAGLAFAEAQQTGQAEAAFRLALMREPKFDRAWYNLGLLLAQANRLPEAAASLRQAELIAPAVADYPYALATVLLRSGDRLGAHHAAQRTLLISPGHPGANQVLHELP